MFKSSYKKSLLFLIFVLFLGKVLFTFYEFYNKLPEDHITKVRSQVNYILFDYNKAQDLNKKFGQPIEKEQTLINGFLLEKMVYNLNQIDSDNLLKFSPIEFRIEHKTEIVYVYFFKKFLNLETTISILYNSLIWTMSLIIAVFLLVIGFYITIYILFLFYKLIKSSLLKNKPVVPQAEQ